MLDFHSYSDTRYYKDGRVVSSTRRPHFTPKNIPRYSFLLEDEWTPGLLNADRRKVARKFPRTLLGIEPGTSHLVPQCVNQLQGTLNRSVQFSHREHLVSHHYDLTHLSRFVAVKSFCSVHRSVAIFVS